MNRVLFLLLILIGWSCSDNSPTEKHQRNRNNIIDVHDKVKELVTSEIDVSNAGMLHITNDYLVIGDVKSYDKLIHLFDKRDFSYILSFGEIGQGPGDITNMLDISSDGEKGLLLISDNGKQCILSYELDSVLTNPFYTPRVYASTKDLLSLIRFNHIDDNLCYGLFMQPTNDDTQYIPLVGKWDMLTNDVELMSYRHPEMERKRVFSAVSSEYDMYVECYWYYDLITIGSLDGTLKYNVYGRKWDSARSTDKTYYWEPFFCQDKIVAIFSEGGIERRYQRPDGRMGANYPSGLIVFDLEGNYLKTIETGYQISDISYDKDNHRVFLQLNDEMQFAYLDLEGII